MPNEDNRALSWWCGLGGILAAFLGLWNLILPYLDTHWQTAALLCIVALILLMTAGRAGSRGWYWVLGVFVLLVVLACLFLYGMRGCCMM